MNYVKSNALVCKQQTEMSPSKVLNKLDQNLNLVLRESKC